MSKSASLFFLFTKNPGASGEEMQGLKSAVTLVEIL